MVMPLRYITSKAEFKALFESEDKKKAVDDFWIKISGNKERAKNMIKLYYNRVQSANQYFVSDKEGWMTDRGMIYIVFGAPDIVYRDGTMETWKYGLQQASKSITFNFYRIENPFTNNDYWIDRSTNYTGPWNNAIEIWRR
jgi:GWxTD domain-containing protein